MSTTHSGQLHDDDATPADCIVYIEQLPAAWQNETTLREQLSTVLGQNAVQVIELPTDARGHGRGWCFIRCAQAEQAQRLIDLEPSSEQDPNVRKIQQMLAKTRRISKSEWLRLKQLYLARRQYWYEQRQQPVEDTSEPEKCITQPTPEAVEATSTTSHVNEHMAPPRKKARRKKAAKPVHIRFDSSDAE